MFKSPYGEEVLESCYMARIVAVYLLFPSPDGEEVVESLLVPLRQAQPPVFPSPDGEEVVERNRYAGKSFNIESFHPLTGKR